MSPCFSPEMREFLFSVCEVGTVILEVAKPLKVPATPSEVKGPRRIINVFAAFG